MTETYNGEGYKIEVNKDNASVFKVYDENNQILEEIQCIAGLVAEKYLPASKVSELRAICERIFKDDLDKLQEIYYAQSGNERFFSENFDRISMVVKIKKSFSKEIQNKIKQEISDMVKSESNKSMPVSISGNKLDIMFMVDPLGYLKSFKKLYNDIKRDDNYSLVNQALELGEAIDKIYMTALKVLEIADKYN